MTEFLSLIFLGSLGLVIGFVGGLAGLVLGVVRFPFIFGNEISAAVTAGTNVGISTLGALTATIRHFRQNNIHRRIFLIMASTGAVGGFLGSLLTKYVPVNLLLAIIGVIVSYEACVLLLGLRKKNHQVQEKQREGFAYLESLMGFAIGFLGGLVGLVLGSIRMPAMISVLKMDPKVAVGTNLASATIMGTFALLGHIINNEIDYLTFAVMGSTAMIGGYMGARFTNRFSPEKLKMLIGFVLIVVALFMFSRVALSY